MRAHFYPEGGWGWLVCAAGFLALLLTTGMQLAFGLLHLYAARHLGEVHLMDIGTSSVRIAEPFFQQCTKIVRILRRFRTAEYSPPLSDSLRKMSVILIVEYHSIPVVNIVPDNVKLSPSIYSIFNIISSLGIGLYN